CSHEVRLLHLAKHLLIDLLVILRHPHPLVQEGQERPKAKFVMLKQALPFGGTSVIFQSMSACLHLSQTILLQQVCQFAGDAIPGWGKVVSCLVECLRCKFSETQKGRTAI